MTEFEKWFHGLPENHFDNEMDLAQAAWNAALEAAAVKADELAGEIDAVAGDPRDIGTAIRGMKG